MCVCVCMYVCMYLKDERNFYVSVCEREIIYTEDISNVVSHLFLKAIYVTYVRFVGSYKAIIPQVTI